MMTTIYETAARAAGWQWDEGGPHFYRNQPGASALEPYQYQHIKSGDWRALCEAEGITTRWTATEIHPGWSVSDCQAVESEGWNIFERDDGLLEIEADAESTIFVRDGRHYDNEAVAFVESQAAAGSAVHKRALAIHQRTALVSRIRDVLSRITDEALDIGSDNTGTGAVATVEFEPDTGPHTIRAETWGDDTVRLTFTVDARTAERLADAYAATPLAPYTWDERKQRVVKS